MSCNCPCKLTFSKLAYYLYEVYAAGGATSIYQIVQEHGTILAGNITNFHDGLIFYTETVSAKKLIIPVCKTEAIIFKFTKQSDATTFTSNVQKILQTTLTCCTSCPEVVDVVFSGDYINLNNADCNFMYQTVSLSAMPTCTGCSGDTNSSVENPCLAQNCVGMFINPCDYVGCSAEVLRRYLESQSLLNVTLNQMILNTDANTGGAADIFGTANAPYTITPAGLGTIILSYTDGTDYYVAVVCLDDVEYFEFTPAV
ncbi:MAG: hypothetical protein ACRCS6_05320 [Turicibacter sp.]